MSKYVLYLLSLYIVFSTNEVTSAIKNGYLKDKQKTEQRLINLLSYYANQDTAELQSKKVNRYLSKLKKQLFELNRSYKRTNILINQLKIIDPALYEEANCVKNKKGVVTDIYVKLVNNISLNCPDHYALFGYTNLAYFKDDRDTYMTKEFGINTVCIYVLNSAEAILTFVHELGHAIYQVENLRTYLKYFEKEYVIGLKKNYGHSFSDPSGLFAQKIEANFHRNYRIYRIKENSQLQVRSDKSMNSGK